MAGPFEVSSTAPVLPENLVTVALKPAATLPGAATVPVKPARVAMQPSTESSASFIFTNYEKRLISRLYGLRPGGILEEFPPFIREQYIPETEMEIVWARLHTPYGLPKFFKLNYFEIRFPGCR